MIFPTTRSELQTLWQPTEKLFPGFWLTTPAGQSQVYEYMFVPLTDLHKTSTTSKILGMNWNETGPSVAVADHTNRLVAEWEQIVGNVQCVRILLAV